MGLGSRIKKKPIPDPGSRGQKGTGSWIRIRNTGCSINHLSIKQLQHQPLINQAAAASTINQSSSCSINHLSINQLQHQPFINKSSCSINH
jgi:hypothetical protein